MALAQALMMGYRPLTTYDFDNKTLVQGGVGTSLTPISTSSPAAWSSDGLTLFAFKDGVLSQYSVSSAFDVTNIGSSTTASVSFDHANLTARRNRQVNISNDGYYAVGLRESNSVEIAETDTSFDFTSNATVTKSSLIALPATPRNYSRSAGLSPDGTKYYVTDENENVYEYTIDLANKTVSSHDATVVGTLQTNLNSNIAVAPDHILVGTNAGYLKIPRVSGSISGQTMPSLITTDSHGTAYNDAIIYANDGSTLWFYETSGDLWYEYDTSN